MPKLRSEVNHDQTKPPECKVSEESTKAAPGASGNPADQDDDGNTHPPKRQRVSRACDQCRAKKDRCDGDTPTCSTCTFLGRTCSYKSNPKKRGVPTGYIRTIELLLGTVISQSEEAEKSLQDLLTSDIVLSQIKSTIKGTDLPESFLVTWKNSDLFRNIDKILYAIDQADYPQVVQQDPHRRESDVNPQATPYKEDIRGACLRLTQHISQINKETHPNSETPRTKLPQMTADGLSSSPSGTNTASKPREFSCSLSSAPLSTNNIFKRDQYQTYLMTSLPSNIWILFDIYYAYSHCWLPIIQKHEVLRTAYSYEHDRQHNLVKTERSGNHAVMWAILALASKQMSLSAARDDADEGNHDSNQQGKLYSIAHGLIPCKYDQLDSDHIAAMLILSLCNVKDGDWSTAWMLVGHAVRIIVLFGWDRVDNGSIDLRSDSKTKGEIQRIVLCCFVLETLVSSVVGRQPFLRDIVTASLVEDGPEEWNPWDGPGALAMHQGQLASHRPLRALSIFNYLVSLSSILSDFSYQKGRNMLQDEQVQPYSERLSQWIQQLPEICSLSSEASQLIGPLPHIFNLHLTYNYISLLVAFEGLHQHPQTASDHYSKRIFELTSRFLESYGALTTTPVFDASLKLAKSSIGAGVEEGNAPQYGIQVENMQTAGLGNEPPRRLIRHPESDVAPDTQNTWLGGSQNNSELFATTSNHLRMSNTHNTSTFSFPQSHTALTTSGVFVSGNTPRSGANPVSLENPRLLGRNISTDYRHADDSRQDRIPPDLDALFDELSSVDEVER